MIYILDHQLIVFYVLTLKLRETIEANFCIPQAKLIAMPFLPSLHKSNPEPKPDHTPQLPPPPLDSPWIISIIEKINQARQDNASSPWESQSIYRVPKSLREVDTTAYTPKIVSIGPYHHGCRHLSTMDRHKWRSLHRVLDRTGHDVRLYLDVARSLEVHARSYYEAPISMSSDDFVETLVLDSIFALELFCGLARKGFEALGYSPRDPVFSAIGIIISLQRDMIMLENQLPLFVLDCILDLLEGCEPSGSYRVVPLVLDFFENLMPTENLAYEAGSSGIPLHCLDVFRRSLLRPSLRSQQSARPFADEQHLHCLDVFRRSLLPRSSLRSQQSARPVADEQHLHCLDVFRRSLLPRLSLRSQQSARPVVDEQHLHCLDVFHRSLLPRSSLRSQQSARSVPDEQQSTRPEKLIHCVADLRNAGIKFRCRKDAQFWDIEFKDGVLYIPSIFIQDGTKSLFLNLIAFEQCHLECFNHITAYLCFMDNLINSEVDVGYLHDKEIIEYGLGSDKEVVDMFNLLCHEVTFNNNDCYLSELSKQVNLYYSNKWNTWRASFNHKYFSNPWTFISLMAAVVMLLLTALQTFYTVYPCYKPK